MKHALKILIVVVVLVVAGALFVITYYPKFAQNILIPEIEALKSVDIQVKGDTLFTSLDIRMHNKGLFKINIDSIDYKISFDTLLILSKMQDLSIVLRPGQSDTFNLPVKLPFKRLFKRVRQLQHRDSADIKSDIRLVYNTVFGHASLPHKKTKRIPMMRPPEFEIEKVEYKGRDKKVLRFLVHLSFLNRSTRIMQVKDISYKMTVLDLLVAEGRVDRTINAVPGVKLHEAIPVEVDVKRPLRTAFLVVTNQDVVAYKMDVDLLFSAGETVDDSRISLTKKGTLELKK